MSLSYLRHRKSEQVCLKSQLTTTNLDTTTDHNGVVIDSSGYREGVFFSKINANSQDGQQIVLDMGIVTTGMTTTSWSFHTSLHTTLTTTANNKVKAVESLPDMVRMRLVHATTSSNIRYSVDACLLV